MFIRFLENVSEACLTMHHAMPFLCAAAPFAVVPIACSGQTRPGPAPSGIDALLRGRFSWIAGPPLFAPRAEPPGEYISIKDPSIVFHAGRRHLFCTVRGRTRSHQIEYLSFADWSQTAEPRRCFLSLGVEHFCAPQVFYFTPHKKWYLICQASDESWEPKYGAAFSTTTDITEPDSWSALQPLGHQHADGKAGLDYWVICDDAKAHLFFTTQTGRLWREETRLEDFPFGWSEPTLAVRSDIFEAAHVYRIKGLGKYLALIEAQGGHGWRNYRAYIADRLEGPWRPLAATREHAFASMANVRFAGERWTDNISHGELLRAGCDERLEVDPAHLRFLIQGVSDREREGKSYGDIPWRLGLLEAAPAPG